MDFTVAMSAICDGCLCRVQRLNLFTYDHIFRPCKNNVCQLRNGLFV